MRRAFAWFLLVSAAACGFPRYTAHEAAAGSGGQGGASGSAGSGGGGLGGLPAMGGFAGSLGESGAGLSAAGEGMAGDGAAGEGTGGTAPMRGTALGFTGTQFLRIHQPVLEDFTLEMWVRTTQVLGVPGDSWFQGAALFDCDQAGATDDFGAAAINGFFAFGTGNPDLTVYSTTAITSGDWTHVAGVRETGKIRVLVNGVVEAELDTGNTRPLTEAVPAYVGGLLLDKFYNGFSGTLDELRLWSVARTEQEIAGNMHVAVPSNTPGLVGYWHFDEGQGLVAANSSPNELDAVLGDGNADRLPLWVSYAPPALP